MATLRFDSRRSSVHGVYGVDGICASSQVISSSVGCMVLDRGGSAADAAVAMAAVLAVVEPCSTGVGGDAFALYYERKSGNVTALLGNGAAPKGLTLELVMEEVRRKGVWEDTSALAVTVPGAPKAWEDMIDRWGSGRLSMSDILGPSIKMAEKGAPIAKVTAECWRNAAEKMRGDPQFEATFTVGDGDARRTPREGELFRNEDLAMTLRMLGERGSRGFYEGPVADAIVEALAAKGGVMDHEDLRNHSSEMVDPISISYRGHEIFEVPPPTHGIAALSALAIWDQARPSGKDSVERVSSSTLHRLIEAMRLAFADATAYISDPRRCERVPPAGALYEQSYASRRASLIQENSCVPSALCGEFELSCSETVQFCVVDKEGNACSMVNSTFKGFGSGIIPVGCGFSLQNRGLNFSLSPGHPNAVHPGARPYHTLMPGMATKNGSFFSAFGVMGGFMQPQGHLQVLVSLIDYDMDPQSALDLPRFCIGDGYTLPGPTAPVPVQLESGINHDIGEELRQRGHLIISNVDSWKRSQLFGRGQVILLQDGVLWAGSDGRADGMAIATTGTNGQGASLARTV